MWFAITANPLNRKKKEQQKEFYSREYEVFLSADTKEELETKIKESLVKYPQQTNKYLAAGIKLVEAENPRRAKKRAEEEIIYIEKDGQLRFF